MRCPLAPEPVLIDFGAARLLDPERTHTRVLTPTYTPLEQHGSGDAQGPWTEIYCLAATTCRVLAGVRPQAAVDRLLDDRHVALAGRVGSGQSGGVAPDARPLAPDTTCTSSACADGGRMVAPDARPLAPDTTAAYRRMKPHLDRAWNILQSEHGRRRRRLHGRGCSTCSKRSCL